MRHVEIHAFVCDLDANTVFDTLADFRHYTRLVDTVVSVDIEHETPAYAHSSWVVKFRNGLLKWSEEDWFRREQLRLDFRQTEGDFEEFFGGWVLEPTPTGVKTAMIVDFDFGVPSLASIVDPVAERVLTDVIHQILKGLFGAKAQFPDESPG